ncbi:hypothetical protein NDU88_003075 [Pleurodeles waltl]|uniref:Uncharacterized protein n=1 Tax=Pleurodeles waltl TaxID=8319 RepID=A0AAV7P8I9_PLEWA|nr:hypothetical protein NDU88_003075 [Pleurodeles waltl]
MLQRSLGLVVQAPPGSVEFVPRSGNAATFSQRKMVQNRSQWLYCRKGLWGFWFGPPRQRRVRPAEQKFSDLFTAPPGTKWQPVALMSHRSLGLVVRAPSGSVELFLRSGNAATFSPCLWVQNGSQQL